MMIFLTVILLIFQLAVLIKGNPWYEINKLFGEEEIRKQQVGSDNYIPDKKLLEGALITIALGIPYILFLLLYLCFSINYDPHTLPTIILLAYFILSVLVAVLKNKKKDLSSEKKVAAFRKKFNKRHTFRGKVIQLVFISYYTYMLIHLIK
ncbi:hypothetical protein LCM23_13175 [Cytobacillus kochii]|uniref:hypothetical protein n=1 Tax=Cytobacillus kochii TaxID=859143 RepID=UPI001CD1F908|nr:hypothetical protein [Cytobacillus kochii]MCA1027047.1 hypothetical protein [Cytobacillus kochii]